MIYDIAKQRRMFFVSLAVVPSTFALIYITWTFAYALAWSVIAGIVIYPAHVVMQDKLAGRKNLAAFASFSLLILTVVIPLALVGTMAASEAMLLYEALQFEEVDVRQFFLAIHDSLPAFGRRLVDAAGYGTFDVAQRKLALALEESLGLVASQFFSLGSGALSFFAGLALWLYVTFFMIRDGEKIVSRVISVVPADPVLVRRLFDRSVEIVRATIKGSLVVGMIQGFLGGITFWIAGVQSPVLLGVLMALASLLPAIGTGLIWVPVAIWLFVTGDTASALLVTFSGICVIGLADNFIRPILVGRETGIPDWMVLVATLGGIATIGVSGIIIGPVILGLFLASWSLFKDVSTNDVAPSDDMEQPGNLPKSTRDGISHQL